MTKKPCLKRPFEANEFEATLRDSEHWVRSDRRTNRIPNEHFKMESKTVGRVPNRGKSTFNVNGSSLKWIVQALHWKVNGQSERFLERNWLKEPETKRLVKVNAKVLKHNQYLIPAGIRYWSFQIIKTGRSFDRADDAGWLKVKRCFWMKVDGPPEPSSWRPF